jgi:hypothetical protein
MMMEDIEEEEYAQKETSTGAQICGEMNYSKLFSQGIVAFDVSTSYVAESNLLCNLSVSVLI